MQYDAAPAVNPPFAHHRVKFLCDVRKTSCATLTFLALKHSDLVPFSPMIRKRHTQIWNQGSHGIFYFNSNRSEHWWVTQQGSFRSVRCATSRQVCAVADVTDQTLRFTAQPNVKSSTGLNTRGNVSVYPQCLLGADRCDFRRDNAQFSSLFLDSKPNLQCFSIDPFLSPNTYSFSLRFYTNCVRRLA